MSAQVKRFPKKREPETELPPFFEIEEVMYALRDRASEAGLIHWAASGLAEANGDPNMAGFENSAARLSDELSKLADKLEAMMERVLSGF